MRKISIAFLFLVMILLTGCSQKELFKELDEVKPNPDHYFLSFGNVTKDNEKFDFISMVQNQASHDKLVVDENTFRFSSYLKNDELVYFSVLINKQSDFDNSNADKPNSFSFGYIDLKTMKVTVLSYFELSTNQLHVRAILDNKIYLDTNKEIMIFDLKNKEILNNIKYDRLASNLGVSSALVIQSGHSILIFRDEKMHEFSLNYTVNSYFILDEKIVLSSGMLINLETKDYQAYDLTTYKKIEDDLIPDLIKMNNNMNRNLYILNGKTYEINLTKEVIKFINIESEEEILLSINDISNNNKDYVKITNIFEKEGYFSQVINQGDELFIIIENINNDFGINKDEMPPIVFKINNSFNDIEYIGYSKNLHSEVLAIYSK